MNTLELQPVVAAPELDSGAVEAQFRSMVAQLEGLSLNPEDAATVGLQIPKQRGTNDSQLHN